jgi:LysM repeat protein
MTTRRRGASDHTEVALSSGATVDAGHKSFQQKIIKEDSKARTNQDGHYSLLNPAPHHPLHTTSASPSHPSFSSTQSSRLQRRRNVESASESSAFASSSNSAEKEHDFPRGKRDIDLPKRTALDRLEGWFGLGESGPIDRNISSTSNLAPPPTRTKAPANPNKTTRLVLVHTVLATDSLEALAIRYNSDVRTLRKANGLWPGDSVQVRKELYIPVDEDAVQTQTIGTNEIGISNGTQIQHANESSNGKLNLLNGPPPTRHDRSMSSASSSAATSTSHPHSSSAFGTGLGLSGSSTDLSVNRNSPELRRVPIQSLSHFPPPGQTPTGTAKVKGSEEQEAFGYGAGMKPDENMEPGESGVEDLLQLAERARMRGADPSSPPSSTKITEANVQSLKGKLPELARTQSRDASTAASSPSLSSKALDEDWKPNKYRLGEKKKQVKQSIANETDEDRSASLGPAMMVAAQSNSTSSRQNYQGWNDIPEPPLSKTAKGQVAHAYKPKRRYPRPGIVAGSEGPGNAFIEDLAAGLPANPGPAANWARPIGESLPIPAERAKRTVSGSSRKTSGASTDAGWGQLLSDTVRGKMRLEDALERGWDDLRSGLLTSGNGALLSDARGQQIKANGGYHTLPAVHAVASDSQAQRPSAEMARAALADTGGISGKSPNLSQSPHAGTSNTHNPSSSSSYGLQVDSGTSASMRRSSGKSMHELEDLRVQNETSGSTYAKTWSANSAPKTGNGTIFAAEDPSSGRTTTTRRNVRNVDWLG